ncbi:lysozyme inhibitor LprI family protein [Allosphingosinicella sp.]|uniref:lysozyme inhibitor LprI family protein n=1 Tax=Allosphingosinicella sp. TaxID=2823234 RepID=UPI002FC15FEB
MVEPVERRATIDKRQLAMALVALVLILAAAVGLIVANRPKTPTLAEEKAVEEKREAIQDLCASRDTFQGLKKLIFDQASRIRTGERVNFDVLAASAFPRMENPVVANRDEALGVTSCTGRFILELPPGAERAFGGERQLVADVRYEVQPAADGSGPVYRMTGAGGIVQQLAAFELEGEPLQLPEDVLATADVEGNEMVGVPVDGTYPGFPPPVTGPDTVRPPAGEWSSPSFDCRNARTRSEVMICGSEKLARRDRRMVEAFDSAMAGADPRTRQILLRTRDNFLAYRERCRSNDCIEEGYEDRMDEIRDIMRDSN